MSDAGWVQDAGWVLPGGGVSAADVSASGPFGATNVQDALDLQRTTFGGDFHIVDTLLDLETFAPADGGGERLLNAHLWVSDRITLPDNEYIQYGGAGILIGPSSAASGIFGNIDGALIRGPVVAKEIAFDNVNANATASVFAIDSTGGRAVRLEYCAVSSGSKVGTISNCLNVVTIERLLCNSPKGGLVLSGTHVATEFVNCAFQGMPAGSFGIDVDASTFVVLALAFNGCAFLTNDKSDRGIRISSSATFPGPALTNPVTPSIVVGLNLLGNKITGPGELYDERAGTLSIDSPKLITLGNPQVVNSRVLGDVDFKDYTTPIIVTYVGPAPTDHQVIPSENAGAATVLELLATSARFSLFRDPADPTNWYIQADGPSDQNVALSWEVSLEANAGGGAGEFLEFEIEKVDRTVTFDLGAAAAAPIGTYTLTLDDLDFDVVLGAPSTRDAVVTSMIALVDADSRFTAVNGADAEQISVTADRVIQATTAAPGAEAWVESRLWTMVPGSESRMEQRVTSRNNTHIAYDVAKVADRYRLSMHNVTATSSTKLQHYNLIAAKA